MNKLITAVLCIVLVNSAFAQQPAHEFSIGGGYGLSSLQYKVDAGSHNLGLGGNAGIGYTCMLSPQWGVSTGAGIAFYKAQSSVNVLTDEQPVTGAADFIFRTSYADYRETQTVACLQIPVMALYRFQNRYYGMAGFKFGFPINARYTGSGNLTTSAYYEYENQEYGNMPDRGLGSFDNVGGNAKLTTGLNLALSAEGGVEFPLNGTLSLRAGIYIDCGLMDIRKGNSNQLPVKYQSDAPAVLAYHSLFDTHYVNKVKSLAAGIKLCLVLRR